MITKKQVIICPPTKHSIHQINKHLKGDTDFQWAYFGEDVSKAIGIEQQLGNKGQHIEIAEKLQETARLLRQSYIDYIGKLSIKNNSLKWWAGYLSEKNPFESKIFLFFCYVKVCQSILNSRNQGECFVFFVENTALRRCMVQNISTYFEYDIRGFESLQNIILVVFKDIFSFTIQKGFFVLNSIYHVILTKYFYKLNHISINSQKDESGLFLIHTWVDHRSFNEKNEYHDTFFGDLASNLKKKGKKVVIVPHILWTVPYHEYVKKLKLSNEKFLLFEQFLNISDILRVTIKEIMDIPKKKIYPLFENLEISDIIFDECKRNWIETRTVSLLLLYDVVKRWKIARIPIDTFIFTYENHIRDKILCIALREFYPSTVIIGYQHGGVSSMYLDHFFSKDELEVLPFPDRIITNGKYTEKLFKDSGYDPGKIVCGGALRYTYLLNQGKNTKVTKDDSHPRVLVTFSPGKGETIELVGKVLETFEHLDKYRITLKFHPEMPYCSIAKDLGVLPRHFIVSDEPVNELLRENDVLLYTTSTTCIEALALGVPVLHVESDFIIDMDILDLKHDLRYSARDKNTIIEKVEEIFRMDQKELIEKRRQWKEAVSEFFGPVDENVFNLFIVG